MKKAIFILLVGIVVLLLTIGCGTEVRQTSQPTPTVTKTVTNTEVITKVVKAPLCSMYFVPWQGERYWTGSDTEITINNVSYGAVIDRWSQSKTLDTGYSYIQGTPMCIFIYNNNTSNQTYSIILDKQDFAQPIGYEQWIELASWNPEVPPRSVANVPMRITIPKDPTLRSEYWQFWLGVKATFEGNIHTASWIKFKFYTR